MYSTKEMCEICNVGRETLRHYEKLGLLTPTINETNGYREYGNWDVGTMFSVKKYQALGLSLDEIKKMLFDGSYATVQKKVEKQQAYFERMAEFYRLTADSNREAFYFLKHAKEKIEYKDIDEINIDGFCLVPYTNDKKSIYFESSKKVMENPSFFTTAYVYDLHMNKDGAGEYNQRLGYITMKKYVEFLKIQDAEIIPNQKVCYQVMEVHEKNGISDFNLRGFQNKMMEKYGKAPDTVYVISMVRFIDEEEVHHSFCFAFSPLFFVDN